MSFINHVQKLIHFFLAHSNETQTNTISILLMAKCINALQTIDWPALTGNFVIVGGGGGTLNNRLISHDQRKPYVHS